jgi:hypothetical protein
MTAECVIASAYILDTLGEEEEDKALTLYRLDTVSSGAGENAKLMYVNYRSTTRETLQYDREKGDRPAGHRLSTTTPSAETGLRLGIDWKP